MTTDGAREKQATTSARPNVNSRPVESAMQSAGQRRLALRTNRAARVSDKLRTYNLELRTWN